MAFREPPSEARLFAIMAARAGGCCAEAMRELRQELLGEISEVSSRLAQLVQVVDDMRDLHLTGAGGNQKSGDSSDPSAGETSSQSCMDADEDGGVRRSCLAELVQVDTCQPGEVLDAVPDVSTSTGFGSGGDPETGAVQVEGEHLAGDMLPFHAGSAQGEDGQTMQGCATPESDLLEYQLKESMWDVALLIGTDSAGPSHSASLVAAALCNVAVQVLFCLVIFANLGTPDWTEERVQQLRSWRATYGHDIRYADHDAKVPLVAMVCAHSASGVHAGFQLGLASALESFLGPGQELGTWGPAHFLHGRLLVNLALMIFLATLAMDVQVSLELAAAVLARRRCADPEGPPEFRVVSRAQLVVFLALSALPRFFVQVVLCYSGSLFLAYTHDMTELILNAVALAFLLDVDELLFAFSTPRTIQMVLRGLRPLRWDVPNSWGRVTRGELLRMVAVAAGLLT